MNEHWPRAELDAVQRLRVLAAMIAGAAVTERVIAAPFEEVWGLLTDLEGTFGEIQPDMRHLHVAQRSGDRLVAHVRSRYGMRARFDGVLRPGSCWLQSRFLLVGMAAAGAPGGGTLVALTGGVRVPGRPALVPIGVRREARRSLDRLERLLT
ncbi:hypothetical protein [Pseudonocardia sp. TRM90224]|uniref:hypothetical protein n=1 Tax=Pseudonocardia sp. TRM90224 TaxID=2812678 RepID=UPI001E487E6F|nr:hypothetical protein [Pseudonocardia sp. TRM90224]